jgi:crotonobetaine/carnitine-CoA ligase
LNTAWRASGLRHAVETERPRLAVCGADYESIMSDALAAHDGGTELLLVPENAEATLVDCPAHSPTDETLGSPDTTDAVDPCIILFTSGTTGESKGVIHSHNSLIEMARQASARMAYSAEGVFYTCLPLCHAHAMAISLLPSFLCGAKLVVAGGFSARDYWSDIVTHAVTTTSLLGTMVPVLVQQQASDLERRHRLRAVMTVP